MNHLFPFSFRLFKEAGRFFMFCYNSNSYANCHILMQTTVIIGMS